MRSYQEKDMQKRKSPTTDHKSVCRIRQELAMSCRDCRYEGSCSRIPGEVLKHIKKIPSTNRNKKEEVK